MEATATNTAPSSGLTEVRGKRPCHGEIHQGRVRSVCLRSSQGSQNTQEDRRYASAFDMSSEVYKKELKRTTRPGRGRSAPTMSRGPISGEVPLDLGLPAPILGQCEGLWKRVQDQYAGRARSPPGIACPTHHASQNSSSPRTRARSARELESARSPQRAPKAAQQHVRPDDCSHRNQIGAQWHLLSITWETRSSTLGSGGRQNYDRYGRI